MINNVWLFASDLLEPVRQRHSQYCISDSFTFANQIRNISVNPNNSFFCSFDKDNLYGKFPRDETIAIYADILCCKPMDPTSVPEPIFLKRIHISIKCLQFCFHSTMHQYIDGVGWGPPPWSTTGEYLCGGKIIWNQQHAAVLQTVCRLLEKYINPVIPLLLRSFFRRCPWCNCYHCRKWTRQLEFKAWTRLIAFHIALIPLGKVWIQFFSLQLWVNSRTDWVFQPWWGN